MRVALIGLLAKAAGVSGMAGGQALDLAAEGQSLGPMEVARMQAMKTGALFDFACDAGRGARRRRCRGARALAAYASAFGQAFQLADDLLDAEGDAAAMGKAAARTPAAARRRSSRCSGSTRRAPASRRWSRMPRRPLRPSGRGR